VPIYLTESLTLVPVKPRVGPLPGTLLTACPVLISKFIFEISTTNNLEGERMEENKKEEELKEANGEKEDELTSENK
jgi:hypothetical protein